MKDSAASLVVMFPLPAPTTGPAELWSEQHPCHLHEGSGEWRCGVGSWAERASLPGRLEEHAVGLWAVREVRRKGREHAVESALPATKHPSVTYQRIPFNLTLYICFSSKSVCCIRSEKSKPGFHESVFCSLQALRDKEFSTFDETMKEARYHHHLDTWNLTRFFSNSLLC